MKEIVVPISFLLLGLFVHSSQGIRCWECNSKYDPNCGNPFQNQTISMADCSQRFLPQNTSITASICRKITQKVQGETRVIRSCGYYNPEDAGKCTMRAGTHLIYMHYCQCAGEGCNTSNPLQRLPFLHLILLLTLVYALS